MSFVDVPGIKPAGLDAATAALLSNPASATAGAGNATYVDQASNALNVKSKGAIGDGTTDDTAAVHAARDAAATFGVGVYFPPGTYVGNFTANKPNQKWTFAPGVTVKPPASSATSTIIVTVAGVTISGGTIDGASTTNPSSAGIYAPTSAVTDLTIENVTIKNIAGYGIEAHGSRTIIRNCQIINTAAQAINLAVGASGDLVDCQIVGNLIDRSMVPASTTTGNIHLAGTTDGSQKALRTKIRGNTLLMPANPTSTGGNMIGIEVHRHSRYSMISGNTTVNGSMGISVAANAHHSAVTGNSIFGPTWYGIEIADSNNCAVVGNTIDGNGVLGGGATASTYGIVANGTVNRLTITGNSVSGMVVGATSSSSCIALANSGTGATITGNVLSAAAHGISISTFDDVTISGNQITGTGGTAGAGIYVNNSHGRLTVAGNQISTFRGGLLLTVQNVTMDNIAVSGNTFQAVTNPSEINVIAGSLGSNIRWSGNVGSGVANTSSGVGDVGNRFITNYYYGPQFGALGTAAPPVGFLHAHPLIVSAGAGLTIQQISVSVTAAAAGATIRVGVYTDSNGLPGTLIEEFTATTQLDASATGDKTLAVGGRVLGTGKYWVAAVVQGATAPTVGILSGANPYVGRLAASSGSGHAAAYTITGVTGALPATFGTPAGTNYAITALLRAS